MRRHLFYRSNSNRFELDLNSESILNVGRQSMPVALPHTTRVWHTSHCHVALLMLGSTLPPPPLEPPGLLLYKNRPTLSLLPFRSTTTTKTKPFIPKQVE
jgi:hypothetical protein